MKKIVFFNTKGGTGKTTICYNYGWYLAEKRNKRILFLDFDPQANLHQAFHKKIAIREGKNLENLIVNYIKKQEINFKDYVIKISSNIDLLPSSNNISLIEEYLTDYLLARTFNENKIYQAMHRNMIIKKVLEQYISPGDYDYVIIDSQPNYSLLSTTSIIYAKNIIMVLKPELFSYLDVKYLKKIITNLEEKFSIKINIAAVIINAYEKRRIASENIYVKFINKYGETFNIINQKIRYLSHYQLSISLNSEPVFISFPSSEASLDLLNAFNEVDKSIDDIEP
ncbi:MAG: ParA family protein [Actinobacteria bacterium]|nr:ParA family protein [Actinomycetota bacterium]